MQAKEYLKNSDLVEGSRGYIDMLVYLGENYVSTASSITAIEAAVTALIAERNNVHTELADGITDAAPVITPAAADAGGKARYIVRTLIQNYEGNVPYGTGLIRDESENVIAEPPVAYPQLMNDFVNVQDTLIADVTARTTMLDLRADVLAALYAVWDEVAVLLN